MTQARLYFIYALSPLHAGTGQGVGVIDLPIARERATNIPIVPGSSLKGVLRDACGRNTVLRASTAAIFGPPTTEADLHAGSLVLSDAHLLLLPVRSLVGTFAWVTSPYLLRRATLDAEDGDTAATPPSIPETNAPTGDSVSCWITPAGVSQLRTSAQEGAQVYLEELDLKPQLGGNAADWARWIGERVWPNDQTARTMLNERICIVHDNVMGYLLETATEVRARVRIDDETMTVARGQLWYEEMLPTESVLMGIALATDVMAAPAAVFDSLRQLTTKTMQVGGKETVGRGLCRMNLHPAVPSAHAQGQV